ncbi:MAG: CARDB domain-containing protein [Candidatus Norongarragalinales archaeon]
MKIWIFAVAIALAAANAVFAEGQAGAVTPLPDLLFEKAEVTLKTSSTGEILVYAKVKNQGDKEALSFFTYIYTIPSYFHASQASAVAWGADCKLISRENSFIEKLLPGESADVRFSITCTRKGRKSFLLKTDFFNKVKESEERNNIAKVHTDFEPRTAVEGCEDSDGGVEPFLKGIVREGYKSAYDVCAGMFLREYYCNQQGRLAHQLITCENGCQDRACRQIG